MKGRYIVPNDTDNTEGYAERMRQRHLKWVGNMERKRNRAATLAAYAGKRYGTGHRLALAARASVRELSPDWSRVSPRGVQRSPIGIGSGGYAQ